LYKNYIIKLIDYFKFVDYIDSEQSEINNYLKDINYKRDNIDINIDNSYNIINDIYMLNDINEINKNKNNTSNIKKFIINNNTNNNVKKKILPRKK
jgi:hypothetical protein